MRSGALQILILAGACGLSGNAIASYAQDSAYECELAVQSTYWKLRRTDGDEAGEFPVSKYQEALHQRAARTARELGYLKSRWNIDIGDSQLQAEIDRMQRDTRDEAGLDALFSALGNSPQLVGECLAKPALANRLVRAQWAMDAELHHSERELAESGRESLLAGAHLDESRVQVERIAENLATPDSARHLASAWLAEYHMWPSNQLVDRNLSVDTSPYPLAPLAQFFSEESQGQSLFVSEVFETEYGFSILAVEAKSDGYVASRYEWPKRNFDSWWKAAGGSFGPDYRPKATAELHISTPSHPESCRVGEWEEMRRSDPLEQIRTGRGGNAVTTGSQVIFWAGSRNPPLREPDPIFGSEHLRPNNEGAIYSPATDTWASMSMVDAPESRQGSVQIWAGTEFFVHGGYTASEDGLQTILLHDGGLYDPISDTWRRFPNAPLGYQGSQRHSAVWTGTKIIVFGGLPQGTNGAILDPVSLTWNEFVINPDQIGGQSPARQLHSAVWAGDTMLVFGGVLDSGSGGGEVRSFAYNPFTGVGEALPPVPAALGLSAIHFMGLRPFWTGQEAIIYASIAFGESGTPEKRVALRYRKDTRTWSEMRLQGDPLPQDESFSAVLVGDRLVVWAGKDRTTGNSRSTGGIYRLSTDTWVPLNQTGVPRARNSYFAAVIGNEAIFLGGECGTGGTFEYCEDGGRLNPTSNSWNSIHFPARSSPPRNRYSSTVVAASETEFYLWGQPNLSGAPYDGGRYDALLDLWYPLPDSADSPGVRSAAAGRATTAWTGSGFLVWGGARSTQQGFQFRNDGAVYDPVSDAWTLIPSPYPNIVVGPASAWDGNYLVVWGGYVSGPNPYQSGGFKWSPQSGWSTVASVGEPLSNGRSSPISGGAAGKTLVWGGGVANGGIYDSALNSWTSIASSATSPPLSLTSNTSNLVDTIDGQFGIFSISGSAPALHMLNSSTGLWAPVSATGGPTGDTINYFRARSTGRRLLVWGSSSLVPSARRGWLLNPDSDAWSEPPNTRQPRGMRDVSMARMGARTVVWGGDDGNPSQTRTSGSMFCEDARQGAQTIDLMVSLTHQPVAPGLGDEIELRATVQNLGPAIASDVVLTLDLQTNLAFQAVMAGGYACTTPGINAQGEVRCAIGSVQPGESIEIVVATQAFSTEEAVSLATVANGDAETDIDLANNVAESRFLVAAEPVLKLLDVTVGAPNGKVISSPSGIDCPGSCSKAYPPQTTVNLVAAPEYGFVFSGWSGACSGSNALCSVLMTQDYAVAAQFSAIALGNPLNVSVEGAGSISSLPAGIACPGNCSQRFPNGTQVQLSATANVSAQFLGWSGACAGSSSTCTLTTPVTSTARAVFSAGTDEIFSNSFD